MCCLSSLHDPGLIHIGFIVNRLLMPMINEAFFALMEDVGSAEDIDRAMKEGCNYPMGPLAVADLIGEFKNELL